jgi:alkylation response protein AidB-like acyl-CoA dehydrogenase
LRKLIKSIEQSGMSGLESLELTINTTEDHQLKSLLLETRDNLVEIEGDIGQEFYSLRNYADIWTARGVLTGRMNLSLFETMPNILIGAGLMFTFIFLSLALTEATYGWSPENVHMKARKEGNDFVLSGTKVFVENAEHATDLLVVAGIEGKKGLRLFHVEAAAQGVAIRPLKGFMVGMGEVALNNVKVAGSSAIGAASKTAAALNSAMLAAAPILCAYQVGGCRRVYEMSLNYAGERKQFGTVIGRFPRVQDHLINAVNALDSARWTTYEALWRLDGNLDGAAASVHVAKSVASEGYMAATDMAHEVHAGMGVLREYGLTLHTKMSRSLYHCLGAPSLHRRRLESALGLQPG